MELPFLDLRGTRTPDVLAAREAFWCARTPFGLAVLRHAQAGRLLRDRRLRQGSHGWPATLGLSGSFAAFWQRSVISQEGAPHRKLREIAQAALAEAHITALVPDFTRAAQTLCDAIAEGQSFDMVADVTEPFAGQAIAALLGQPADQAAAIARDASTLGLAMGPDGKQHEAAVNAATDRLTARAGRLLDDPPPGSFSARLVASGYADRQALIDLIVISIFGGVDTTRAQLAFAAELFARHRDQWDWLRTHPEAIPQAIEEIIRMRPTTTWATREVEESFSLDGVWLARGEILHILVHATGTDPETGHDGRFDITRKSKAHLGFGGGAHHCLGHFVARTDMAAALRVMCASWTQIALAGTPEFLPDSGNTSPRYLPLRITRA